MPSQASLALPRPDAAGRRGPHLDTAAALIMEVAREVRDPSVTEDRILVLLNRALLEVAGRACLPGLVAENTAVLPPGAEAVDLPADYHHSLVEAACLTTRRRLRLASGLEELSCLCRPQAAGPGHGRPRAAAVVGARLFVRPRPQATTMLLVRYQRLPAPLEADTDRPDGLPVHLASELLVSRACRDLYEGLEEGVEDKKVQTGRFETRFETAMDRLRAFVGERQAVDVPVPDVLGLACPEAFL